MPGSRWSRIRRFIGKAPWRTPACWRPLSIRPPSRLSRVSGPGESTLLEWRALGSVAAMGGRAGFESRARCTGWVSAHACASSDRVRMAWRDGRSRERGIVTAKAGVPGSIR